MPSDVSGTIAGLNALVLRVHEATRAIVTDAAHIYQAKAMAAAPVGETGNSTNAPGDLRRSIQVDGPYGTDGSYVARVGPTVMTANPGVGGRIFNYGRIREFGGGITPNVAPYLVFTKFGTVYKKVAVYSPERPYLRPARAEGTSSVEATIAVHLAAAVKGG